MPCLLYTTTRTTEPTCTGWLVMPATTSVGPASSPSLCTGGSSPTLPPPALPPGATVLDVGTGPGTLPLLIAAQSPHLSVSGVDLSAEMIARATAAADVRATPGASPISFRIADVADLPFDDQSVDLVVSTLSMHHWADPAAGLREVVRVLRPGACAWLYDFRPTTRRAARMTPGLNVGGSPREPTHRDMAAQPDRSTRSPSRELKECTMTSQPSDRDDTGYDQARGPTTGCPVGSRSSSSWPLG